MEVASGKVGLVLAGGGARAAYQVGVLQAIKEMLPDPKVNPFPIIGGTSAGAVNAGALACNADDFGKAVDNLLDVWRNFEPRHVYRSDFAGVVANSTRWLASLFFGAIVRDGRVSLLDNRPLAALLARKLEFERIPDNIAAGALDALAITCSGYTSGQSVTFFEGAAHLGAWKRSQRVGIRTKIQVEHLMASSAIPFLFPAHKLNREFFGDGSMRQIAPVSPALHLGADRVVVVGTARIRNDDPERTRGDIYPTLAQVAGHVMNSIFLDSLAVDIERLERINRTISAVPRDRLRQLGLTLHHVDVLVMTPSQPLDAIAIRHLRSLPWPIRFLLRLVGAMRRGGANLASYLLFEQGYCRELVNLGYHDTMKRRDEVEAFLGGAMCPVPGAYARTVKFFVPPGKSPEAGAP
ncbi:MAG: patatin-like phospholipase family protein [Betaproteobacteria bacterium]|nr:patatin-like phospholipase family protein [Betaproteobacteria bacterium]